jgi:hypothetical protein
MEALSPKQRLRLLLDHFAAIEDDRAAWRVIRWGKGPPPPSLRRRYWGRR